MQTCGKILVTVMLILTCSIALNHAMAQGPVNQSPLVKGHEVITDLSNGAPYQGMTAAEQAKLTQLNLQEKKEVVATEGNGKFMVKPAEVKTDLGSGIPYQGLTATETEKYDQWQILSSQPGSTTANSKVEKTTDEGAGRLYQGLNSAEKSKLEASTANKK